MEGFRRSVAILVAIDRYENGVPPLRTPVGDADELAKVLSEEHFFETEIIVNEEAKAESLRARLLALQSQISEDDRVVFYFAGHGIALEGDSGPEGYILPQDAKHDERQTFISMVELQSALLALPCRHMLVVLDCCFAGAFRWANTRQVAPAAAQLHKERFRWFVQDAAWQAIASAAHDEEAIDIAGAKPLGKRDDNHAHSPFAAALIRGLRGAADLPAGAAAGDGVITATELYLYIEAELRPDGQRKSKQTPILWPLQKHDKGQFVFLAPKTELSLPDAPPLDEKTNPWRGLTPYDAEHHDLFYGRGEVSKSLVEFVLSKHLVVVTGPSGIGKSSLVRAGLVPRLRSDHRFQNKLTDPIIVRPGPDPFQSLARALRSATSEETYTPDGRVLRSDPAALKNWVESLSGVGEVFLVIDQAEELITMSHDGAVMRDYLTLIERAIVGDSGVGLRALITVRSEYEPQFAQSPLNDGWAQARFLVPPMTQDELRRVIEGPAAVKVMRFESSDLVEQLVNEVVQMPGALPLLSFALSQMYLNYLRRRSSDRALTAADYEALQGGVVGSLKARANDLVGAWDDAHKRTVRRLLKRLLTLGTGEQLAENSLASEDPADRARIDRIISLMGDAGLVVIRNDGHQRSLQLGARLSSRHLDHLMQQAERAFHWYQESARRVLERFVSVDVGQFARRRVPRREFVVSDSAEQVRVDKILDEFDSARLIVSDKIDDEPFLELAHDALILGWDRLLSWVRGDALLIADLRRLTSDAATWIMAPKEQTGRLWSDPARLSGLKTLTASAAPGLNLEETRFALASFKRARRNQIIRWSTICILIALTIGLAFLAWFADDRRQLAEVRAREAKSQQLAAEASVRNVGDIGVPEESVILALHSLSLRYSPQGFNALMEALDFLPNASGKVDIASPPQQLRFIDSGQLLVGVRDTIVDVIDAKTNRRKKELPHKGRVLQTFFSPPSGQLLTIGSRSVSVWDIKELSFVRTIEFDKEITGVSMSPDALDIAVGFSGGAITIISCDNLDERWQLKVSSSPRSISFLDTNRIAVAVENPKGESALATSDIPAFAGIQSVFEDTRSNVFVLNFRQNTWEKKLPVEAAASVLETSPDGTMLAVGLTNGKVNLFNSVDWANIGEVAQRARVVRSMRFLTDDILAIASQSGVITLYSVAARKVFQTLPHSGLVRDMAVDGKRQHILSLSADGIAYGWNLAANSMLVTKRGRTERFRFRGVGAVRSIALDTDTGMVAMGDAGGNVYFASFDAKSPFEAVNTVLGGLGSALALDKTRSIAAFATNAFNKVVAWPAGSEKASWIGLPSINGQANIGASYDMDLEADGSLALTANGNGLYIRSTASPSTAQKLEGGPVANDWVYARFQGGGANIVGATTDTVAIWREKNGDYQPVTSYPADDTIFAIAGHPTRPFFFTAGNTLSIRKIADGTEIGKRDLGDTIEAIGLDQSGECIAVGTASGRVVLLRGADWDERLELGHHEEAVTYLAVSSNCQFIASVSGKIDRSVVMQGDQSLRLWSVSEHRELLRLPVATPAAVQFDAQDDLALLEEGRLFRVNWSVPGLIARACGSVQQDLSPEIRAQFDLPPSICQAGSNDAAITSLPDRLSQIMNNVADWILGLTHFITERH